MTTCDRCGAVVHDELLHAQWHWDLDRITVGVDTHRPTG